nr:MAG TPA: YopX protein [Caudoviricetes sp.]
MQVIKFRGRSIADGSIVYGGVLQYATASYIVQPDTRHADAAPRCIEVYPDSVAQYTNRRAVDGREIYEGDEVKFFVEDLNEFFQGVVYFDEDVAGFCVEDKCKDELFGFDAPFKYILINQALQE